MIDIRVRRSCTTPRVRSAALRQVARALVDEGGILDPLGAGGGELGILLVGARRIAQLNRRHLFHEGATDVIAFAYGQAPGDGQGGDVWAADIVICPAQARSQGRRYRVAWQQELLRYLVHGLLHLAGMDDRGAAQRRAMKRAEDRWLRWLGGRHPPQRLSARTRPRG